MLPPRADEVRVRIVAAGICHTDVAVKEQSVQLPLPMVLGHRGVVMGDANAQTFVPCRAALFCDGRLPFDRFVCFYDFDAIDQAAHDSAVTGEVIKPILRTPA